jgi:hypothetical protein
MLPGADARGWLSGPRRAHRRSRHVVLSRICPSCGAATFAVAG